MLALSAFLLVCFGLVAIYSVTLSGEGANWDLLTRQLVAVALGLGLFFGLAFFDYQLLQSYARWLYGFGLLILTAVLIFGSSLRGTKGWFVIGGWSFQPVEVVKIVVIIFLAYYFSRQSRPLNQLKYFIISGLGVLAAFALTILQPDFGSGLILFFLWLGVVLVIGPRWWHLALLLVAGLAVFLLAWNFAFAPYQKDRIRTFLDPAADPLGAGYNVSQSMIAIGAGGWTGQGLSLGSQSQLRFLPEAQTDFVFAVIAEELGLLGVLLLLGLWSLIFWRLFVIARRCHDDFSLFLILGIILLFLIHLLMNIGMNLGLAPVTGITLPLVSYGGSSLIFMLGAIGIAESVRLRN
ncbi:MAG: rod shape-determining protein RodA [Patescibacteria group bacterium]